MPDMRKAMSRENITSKPVAIDVVKEARHENRAMIMAVLMSGAAPVTEVIRASAERVVMAAVPALPVMV